MSDRDKRQQSQAPRRRHREAPADRQRIGTTIAGSYRIDEFLGRGAIGAVFGGMHLRLERRVAVKFVDPTLVDDPEIRARFKREARICAQIGSSHVVEVFDYGVTDEGAPYLVMEHLDGEDLHQRIQREGPLSVARALRIAKQVCLALGAAHANGIVHRDLKPENVFILDRDGEPEFVKVVDFGLSTFVQSDDTRLTRAGQSVGTPLYMAPEQAGAHSFDARVDVYSLGVLIFETTTGRLPFEANTLQALLVALATQPPRSLQHYKPELPIELDDLVLRFIARDPRVRPKTAAAALAEIVALEERLAARAQEAPKQPPPAPAKAMAISGLPGAIDHAFLQEVHSHLTELRRTGRLATSEVAIQPSPETQRGTGPSASDGGPIEPIPDTVDASTLVARRATPPPPSGPPSSNDDKTRPMERRELDEMLSEPVIPAAPRRPASHPPPAGTRSTSSSRQKRAAPRAAEIEEDSQVFYGRISRPPLGRERIEISQVAAPSPSRRTDPPPPMRAPQGPPKTLLVVAVLAFLVVAAMIAARVLQH